MNFWYQVILKPMDVKFTCSKVSSRFKNGRPLKDLLDDILNGRQLVKDSPALEVVWSVEKWEWYTLDNRLLWVFHQLEKASKVAYVEMRRIEFNGKGEQKPTALYEDVEIVDEDIAEPISQLPAAMKVGRKGYAVRCISKKLKRLHLSTLTSSKGTLNRITRRKTDCNGNSGALEGACNSAVDSKATSAEDDVESGTKTEFDHEIDESKGDSGTNGETEWPEINTEIIDGESKEKSGVNGGDDESKEDTRITDGDGESKEKTGANDEGIDESEINTGANDEGIDESEIKTGANDEGIDESEINTGANDGIDGPKVKAEINDGIDESEMKTEINDGIDESEMKTEINDGINESEMKTEINDGINESEMKTEINDGIDESEMKTEINDGIDESEMVTVIANGSESEVDTGITDGNDESEMNADVNDENHKSEMKTDSKKESAISELSIETFEESDKSIMNAEIIEVNNALETKVITGSQDSANETLLCFDASSSEVGDVHDGKCFGMQHKVLEEYEDTNINQICVSIRSSRSPSVCSSVSEGRGVDDWGRRERRRDLEHPDLNETVDVDLLDENEWIDIDVIDANLDEAEESSNDDVIPDKEIAKRPTDKMHHSSNDSGFDALLSQREISGRHRTSSSVFSMPRREGLSESLLSLDSAFSSSSALSLSSIARDQRHISSLFGLYGYETFDKYNAEYLSKLRAERQAAKRRLMPYDASKGRYFRTTFGSTGEEDWDSSSHDRSRSASSSMEERVTTRRTYSETLHYKGGRGQSFSEKSYRESEEVVHYRSSRRPTDPVRRSSISGSGCSSFTERNAHGSHSKLAPSRSTNSQCGPNSVTNAIKKGGFSKERLYNLWQARREEYLDKRYSGSVSNTNVALMGYTCGLCFKTFKTRNRLEQHGDELMHWACITCGRFFASHTALGQHIETVGHRKD